MLIVYITARVSDTFRHHFQQSSIQNVTIPIEDNQSAIWLGLISDLNHGPSVEVN